MWLWIVPATAIEYFGCKCLLSVSEAGDFFIRELPAHFGKAVCCALDGKPLYIIFLGATASCCYEAAAATAIFVLGADGGWVKLIFFKGGCASLLEGAVDAEMFGAAVQDRARTATA